MDPNAVGARHFTVFQFNDRMSRSKAVPFHGIPFTFSQLRRLLNTSQQEYPWSVHIGHDLISIASYRQWRGAGASLLHAFLASFHFGNGGTPITNVVMGWNGGAHPLVASPNQAAVWSLMFAAVYKSPLDFVYRMLTTARHPVRVLCLLLDQIDAVTSMVNVMEKAAHTFPANPLAPIFGGISILSSGGIFNHIEALSLGRKSTYPWATFTQRLRRTVAFVLIYAIAMRYRVQGHARWWLTIVSLVSTICVESTSFDPLNFCDDAACNMLAP
eukprot:m.1351684 g.1351684  ORF g.1351684 m.1351684 type:complete len:272 (+) comp24923_c0_seq29:121-936(+)